MQVSVEAGEGLERRMRVELPFEDVESEVEKRLRQLAPRAKLAGFRPGKVPMTILRQRYTEQLHHEAFGDMVQSSLYDALREAALTPAGMPHVEPDFDIAARRIAYTAIFEILPDITLVELKDQVIKRPVSELTDTDLDEMIERLRTQRQTWQAAERPAQIGDRLTINFVGTIDGEAFDGGTAENYSVELGEENLIAGFEEGLVGVNVGETRSLDLTFPDPYHDQNLAGKPVRFEVTVTAISAPVCRKLMPNLSKHSGSKMAMLSGSRPMCAATWSVNYRIASPAAPKSG